MTDLSELKNALRGVATVAITPFDDNLVIDEAAMRRVVRYLDDGGTDTLVVGGGTGEFYALTPAERRQIVEIAADEVQRAPLVVSVGLDAATAAADAKNAERLGAAGVMIHQPIHPYTHPDGLRDYYRTIAAATDIGLVPYIRDPRVGVDLVKDILSYGNVVAVKYAVNNIRSFADIVQETRDVSDAVWVCGTAEIWAPFFAVAGSTGFTSGLANFAIAEALRMRDALVLGNQKAAMEVWERIRPIEDLRSRWHDANNVAVLKAGAALVGLSGDRARPPLRTLPAGEREELAQILRNLGIKVTE
ncbi:MAG: dihydrodipicolinate synthase family protein [Microbacterium sp.]